MEDAPQGTSTMPEPATQIEQGQIIANPAGSADPNLAQEPAADPAVIQGNGQGTPQNDQHFQNLYNRTLAENFALQQRLQKQMETSQQQVQRPPQNPYDPQTQSAEWWRHENQTMARTAAEEARRATREEFGQVIQTFQKQQWLSTHSQEMQRLGITQEHLEAFNQMNGIPPDNYEVGLKLMMLPTQMNNVARQAQQQTINNFRQPQTGAIPIRGGLPSIVQTPQYSYEVDALEYQNTSGRVYDTWTPEKQQAFDAETDLRRVSMYGSGDRTVR